MFYSTYCYFFKMFRHILFVSCLMALYQTAYSDYYDYRCKISGCNEGAKCLSNGMCDCDHSTRGLACDISEVCDQPYPCVPENTIIDGTKKCSKANVYACLCKPGYFDQNCDKKIFDVSDIGNDEVQISVTPHSYSKGKGFTGRLYFSNDKANFDDLSQIPTHCALPPKTPIQLTFSVATKPTASTPDCGLASLSGTKYTYYFYVQHVADVQSVEDQIIKVTYDKTNSASVSLNSDVIESKVEVQEKTASQVSGITMKIRKDRGANLEDFGLHDIVNLNDKIALTFESKGKFMVQQCKITDGESKGKELTILDNWCATNAGRVAYSEPIKAELFDSTNHAKYGLTSGLYAVKFPLQAFKFSSNTGKMNFECSLCTNAGCAKSHAACQDNTAVSSALETYHLAVKTFSRRKRSLDGPQLNGVDIAVEVKVSDLFEGTHRSTNNNNSNHSSPGINTSECFKSAVVLSPLILLASLLIIATTITFFICIKFTNNMHMSQKQNNLGVKA